MNIQNMDEQNRRSNLSKWIANALSSHLQSSDTFSSNSSTYLELTASIRTMSNPIEMKRLCIVFVGCLGTVAMHSNQFQDLIQAIFSVDWVRCHKGNTSTSNTTVATCYVSMLGHLISQNSCFLPPCFQMLVRNLLFQDEDIVVSNVNVDDQDDQDDQEDVEDEDNNNNNNNNNIVQTTTEEDEKNQAQFIHSSIHEMLQIAPLYASVLMQVLEDNAPHSRLSVKTQKSFVVHALHMTEYVPALLYRILVIIIDRMIAIDVAIKLEDVVNERKLQLELEESLQLEEEDVEGVGDDGDGGSADEEENEDEEMFSMDQNVKVKHNQKEKDNRNNAVEQEIDSSDDEANEMDSVQDIETPERPRMLSQGTEERAHMTNQMADKLDVMMDVLFHYLSKHMRRNTLQDTATTTTETATPVTSSKRKYSTNYNTVSANNSNNNSNNANNANLENLENLALSTQLFELLLRVFEDTILNTYRSKYVQFLIFYVCQFDASYVELYVSRMLGRMLHPQAPIITQRACAAYVASFLSRAKYVKPMAVVSSLHYMVVWASEYVTTREPLESSTSSNHLRSNDQFQLTNVWLPGAKQHETFYSICQACFYIICFLGEDAHDREKNVLQSLPWVHVIFSPLNPLKYCLHDVRNEFVNISKITNLLGNRQEELEIRVSHIMETMDGEGNNNNNNNGNGSNGSNGSNGNNGSNGSNGSNGNNNNDGNDGKGETNVNGSDDFVSNDNPLDSFFPYDPYLLSVSSLHIDPIYVVWSRNDEDDQGKLFDFW